MMGRKCFGIVLVVLVAATCAWANGYKVLATRSTKATGMAEAFITQADDPSAVAFNPAGLSQVDGTQVGVHATVCGAYTLHRAPTGEKARMVEQWQTVPSVFATTDLGREDMTLGIGISLPNGLSSEWEDDSFARYVATYSDLYLADISPAFGMAVTDRFRIGGAVNFFYSEAVLKTMRDSGSLLGGAPNGVDVRSKLEGSGTAVSGSLGAIYEINARHRVAATYRHPMSIDYDGDLTVAGVETDVDATIDYPMVIVLGYGFKPTDAWKVEINADWTGWSDTDDIDIGGMAMEQNLKNTVAWKLGAEYAYSDTLALRVGYIYNENATPEASWRPSLPDTDMHFFTGGFGYRMGAVTIDGALQIVLYNEREVDNNVDFNEAVTMSSVDGTYQTWAPCVSVGATYRF